MGTFLSESCTFSLPGHVPFKFFAKSIGFVFLSKRLQAGRLSSYTIKIFLLQNETYLNAFMRLLDLSVYGLWYSGDR